MPYALVYQVIVSGHKKMTQKINFNKNKKLNKAYVN